MSEELLVNVTPRETRVAVVENGMLQELHIERGSQRGVVGNIYKGKVQRVMPGMQAAFVDIGLDRAAFLHANDIFRSTRLDAGESDDAPAAPPLQAQVPITDLLRDGAEIVVQVVKDPIGSKGARLTTQISIPSRYLVLLPRSKVIGISAGKFGGGTMLPGLERVLQGLEAGAKKDGVLKAKEAFGNPSMHPVKKMKRTEFPADTKLKLGERFMAKGGDGNLDVVLAIEKLAGDDVEVRLVHPLADKDLRYECEVVAVTDPKPPPLPAKALKLDES